MSEVYLVDPEGWEFDLQSVYSAYTGYFQLHSVRWDDRAWGHFFETFEQFLAFSWPVITMTDARTGRAHIVTRTSSIIAFLKMIKTRFGETLPQVDNMFLIKPVETAQRQLWHINDWTSYSKLHSTLPAVALAALKTRIKGGDSSAIRQLWAMKEKTFLAIDFEFLERNDRSCVEWGYAAIRSSQLEVAGAWPPVPDTNYRKGHYIVSEYAEALNKASPSLSWQYAFGESQVISRTKLPRIIQSVLSGLISPDSETVANNVVLVGHGAQVTMQRLDEMGIKLPSNVLVVDIAYLERALFTSGERGQMHDRKTGKARLPESLLGLSGLLYSLGIDPPCALHNAGNDAFMALVAFQRMADPQGAVTVTVKRERIDAVGAKAGTRRWSDREAVANGNANRRIGRATTVASRIFRPLGGTHPDPGTQRNEKEHGHGHSNGHGHGAQMRVAGEGRDKSGVDEMGMRRMSMFSMLTSTSTAPADKNRNGRVASSGSTKENRMSVELRSNGRPLPSTVGSDRKRHSIMGKHL